MIPYKKLNNITGWFVFAIATLVYTLTVEPTASYWDCGEFIATSYKLEVSHPPGAPFFMLVGRMFSFLAFGDVEQVAFWVNMLSVLSSGLTIMFLFWTITQLGRKFYSIESGSETKEQTLLLMSAGIIGSMAYTFSDSFWFSAVEAEVYAMSSFFTALVFWAILKWELIPDEASRNRWLVLIAYMVGLSIGAHLLNLVTIPALALIVYFRRHPIPTGWGVVKYMIGSGLIIIVIMAGIIPGIPSLIGGFERLFVNNIGLPFGSGVVFFFVIFIGALIYGIQYSIKHNKATLNTALISLAFILIGYSSYGVILIRSNNNPPINENSPDDVMSFVSYLKREQYGNRPLFYGQYFTAELVDQVKGDPIYTKGKDKYEITDYKFDQVYDPKESTILPRAYSSAPSHVQRYREVMGLRPGQKPNFIDNLHFMFSHQLGHMYMRYFMWNFAGRQSDIQDADWMSINDTFKAVPAELANNKGRNNYFMIPLLLGLIGLFFQANRDPKNFAVVAMLFFLTGVALILYLNSPPVEPRERDYIYAGSYYAYSIWLAFGVFGVHSIISRFIKKGIPAIALTTILCISAPVLMAVENWDDHDRSGRYFSVDSAKNFLASCAPNAILFTGGDNDTFPLWYVQEVEGFRTDVRVIVLSYFNTDWYINQMRRHSYESEPLPFTLENKHYVQGGLNDYLPIVENPSVKGAINLTQLMKLIQSEHPGLQIPTSISAYNSIPAKNMYLNIDTADILKKNIVPDNLKPLMVSRMEWGLKGSGLEKKDLMILDLMVANNWERPIYFNNTSLSSINMDFRPFVAQEGNSYRLLPVRNPDPSDLLVNTEAMYDNLMNNYHWRGLQDPNIYNSEDYRNFVLNHRATFYHLAEALFYEGEFEKAGDALKKSLEVMPDSGVPYDHFNVQYVDLLLRLDENDRASDIAEKTGIRADQMLTYYFDNDLHNQLEIQRNLLTLSELARAYKSNRNDDLAKKYEEMFRKHYSGLN
ncbi:MAG: DUF2723 domain-containing protein [Bacteroidetes bacterium]|nr:DUF2723 domain-containing protein [Bacteroidota bacterium]MDA1120702.1 DUF2723 domain-containing protein [Bacteroidota bacterium]